MRIVDLKEMQEIEHKASQDYGFHESLVVENVGLRAAEYLQAQFLSDHHFGEIVVMLGRGNNGSDGLALARQLKLFGHSIRAFTLFPLDECSEEFKSQLHLAEKFGVKITELTSSEQLLGYFTQAQEQFFVIDAIFGTGVRLPLSNFLRDIINLINQYSNITISIDIPTGIHGETGAFEGCAIIAHTTLAIGLPKIGHYVSYGPRYMGDVFVVDAGFPDSLLVGGDKTLLSVDNVSNVLSDRSEFAHKNTFGHTLLIGGSRGLTGALILAAQAAMRVGSGLVTAVTWEDNYQELTSRVSPEIMTALIPNDESKAMEMLSNLSHYDSIVIGPGIGRSERSRRMVLNLIQQYSGPLIIDADAINVLHLAEDASQLSSRQAVTLMTPHLGEFARLIDEKVEDIQETPLAHIAKLIDQLKCSVLLKGPSTYLGFPNGDIFINYFPNEGLATGGSGDVLAGILGGLFAQRATAFSEHQKIRSERFYEDVCLGTVVHSLSGKFASEQQGKRSMSANSIVDFLAQAFLELEKSAKI